MAWKTNEMKKMKLIKFMDGLWKGTCKIYGKTGDIKNKYSVHQRDQQVCSWTFFSSLYSRMFSILKLSIENFENTEENKEDNINPS